MRNSGKADPHKIEKLVESSETVIQVETTGWVQEMRDALGTLYEEKEPQPKNDNEERRSQKARL